MRVSRHRYTRARRTGARRGVGNVGKRILNPTHFCSFSRPVRAPVLRARTGLGKLGKPRLAGLPLAAIAASQAQPPAPPGARGRLRSSGSLGSWRRPWHLRLASRCRWLVQGPQDGCSLRCGRWPGTPIAELYKLPALLGCDRWRKFDADVVRMLGFVLPGHGSPPLPGCVVHSQRPRYSCYPSSQSSRQTHAGPAAPHAAHSRVSRESAASPSSPVPSSPRRCRAMAC